LKTRSNTDAKLEDSSGEVCVMIDYANQHSADTYRLYDPMTQHIYTTHDVQWLGRLFRSKTHDAISDGYYTIEISDHVETHVSGAPMEGEEELHERDDGAAPMTTRSGRRVIRPPFLQNSETGFFSSAELNYLRNLRSIDETFMYDLDTEINAVATTGTVFKNTAELKSIK
jgi:hypothetical protein